MKRLEAGAGQGKLLVKEVIENLYYLELFIKDPLMTYHLL